MLCWYKKEGGEAADELISSLIHTSETAPSTATNAPVVVVNIVPVIKMSN